MMIKLVSKNKYVKIRDSESSSTDVFLVMCGLLLSRPSNGNVITKDNIKIEEYDNSYHNVNDGIEDLHAYNEQMKQKVLTKYKHDIELIGFDLTSYV